MHMVKLIYGFNNVPLLEPSEVHVWSANLERLNVLRDQVWQILSIDERMRYSQYRNHSQAIRFMIGRGLLRNIVGLYTDTEPSNVGFTYEAFGKPLLARQDQSCFNFSVSHSGEIVVFAIALNRQVGIDIEQVRPFNEIENLMAFISNDAEMDMFNALPANLHMKAFYNCWTRKEACLKAIGIGLAMPMTQIVVEHSPNKLARIMSINGDFEEASHWCVRSIEGIPDSIAALVCEGSLSKVRTISLELARLGGSFEVCVNARYQP